MLPSLAIFVVLIRTAVQAIQDIFPRLFKTPDGKTRVRAVQTLVYVVSAVALSYSNLDILAMGGIHMPAFMQLIGNTMVLGIFTMLGHDAFDKLAEKL